MESESSESTFRDFFVKSFLVLPKPPKEMEDAKPLNDCTLASSFPTLTPTTSLEFSNYVFSSLTFGRTRTILAKWKLFISRELGEKKTCKKWFQFFPLAICFIVWHFKCSAVRIATNDFLES